MKTTLSTLLLLSASLAFAHKAEGIKVESDKTTGCVPLEVRFSGTSAMKDGSFKWTFSNGATSSEKNPSIVFFGAWKF